MATYRNFYTKFWNDPTVQNLTKNETYLLSYLFTNEHTSPCGIYEITFKTISAETKLTTAEVSNGIKTLHNSRRIYYNEPTNEICIINWLKYNCNNSPKLNNILQNSFDAVKEKGLIGLLSQLDMVSIPLVYDYVLSYDSDSSLVSSFEAKKQVKRESIVQNKEVADDVIFKVYSSGDERLYSTLIRFLNFRIKIGKPLTEEAKNLLCEKLTRIKSIDSRQDIVDCINESILNNWSGVFPLKQIKKPRTEETLEENIARRVAALGGEKQ